MQFIVLNEYSVQKYNIQEKHIVISITSPESNHIKLPESNSRVAALFLKFSDIDRKIESPKVTLFTQEQASAIWNFFNFYKNKIKTVVVNCEVGVCRSPAIAAALSKTISQDDSRFFKYYAPNMYVYRAILNEANKNLNLEE